MTASERLTEALRNNVGAYSTPDGAAKAALAADPALAADIEFGQAWREAEAVVDALTPAEMWAAFQGVRLSQMGMKDQWVASYEDEGGYFNFYGPTPTKALRALSKKLLRVPA